MESIENSHQWMCQKVISMQRVKVEKSKLIFSAAEEATLINELIRSLFFCLFRSSSPRGIRLITDEPKFFISYETELTLIDYCWGSKAQKINFSKINPNYKIQNHYLYISYIVHIVRVFLWSIYIWWKYFSKFRYLYTYIQIYYRVKNVLRF